MRDLEFVLRNLDFYLRDLDFDLGSKGPAGDRGGVCALEMVGGREFESCLSVCVRWSPQRSPTHNRLNILWVIK